MKIRNIVKKISAKAEHIKSKAQKKIVAASAVLTTIATGMTTAFAAAPNGVDTTKTNAVVDIVVWIAVIAIGAFGGYTSVIKLVEGQANEDVRGRNSGIAGLVVTGACAGAVFALKAIFF